MMTLPELLELIRWDMRANPAGSFDRIRARLLLVEIRVEQYIYRKLGHRCLPLRGLWYLIRFLGSIFQWALCNSNIPGTTTIGRGLRLPHPQNIIIAGFTDIGQFCTVYQNVSIAWNGFEPTVPLRPYIGDQVLLGAGAIIIGDISIGSYVLVGAGVVVADSVPEYSRVTNPRPQVSSRYPSSQAAVPGSEQHMQEPYSIWR